VWSLSPRQCNEANALLQLVRSLAQPPPTPSARHGPDRGRQECPASCDNPSRPSLAPQMAGEGMCAVVLRLPCGFAVGGSSPVSMHRRRSPIVGGPVRCEDKAMTDRGGSISWGP